MIPENKKYDIAVIGSGPGGFAACVRAAQLGAKVVLIDKSETGGTCLNRGCIPTKFLWQALNTKNKIKKSYEYGFKAVIEPFNFADIIARKDRSILNLRKGMEMILSSYSIDILKGSASFKSNKVLEIFAETTYEIVADKIIIAAGTEPAEIGNLRFDGDKVISSADILNLNRLPESILIVGGGAIGIEFASILSGFGSKVTLAELQDRLLPGEDCDIADEIKKNLQRQGVEVLLNNRDAVDNIGQYEKILLAAGRKPVKDLKTDNAGLKLNSKGFIETDEYCLTSVDNIYAVGDIAGKNMLAYTAQNEGTAAGENAVCGNKIKVENDIVPVAVFSNPPAASVKNNKNIDGNDNVVYGKFPFTASGRAFIEGERNGFVKCAADKTTKQPLGFWIIGAHADELVNTAAAFIRGGAKCVRRESLFHPSLSEALLNAYDDAFEKCSEIIKRK